MKKTINIVAKFDTEGNIYPIEIIWNEERTFSIDKITDIRHASSLKSGGAGLRYTCSVCGHQRYLFYERGIWFIEKKE